MDSPQPLSPSPPRHLHGGVEGAGNEGEMLSLGEGAWGGRCSRFCLSFSFSELILIGNKLNSFSQSWACFVPDSNWWVISLSLSWPIWAFPSYCLPDVLLRRGNERAAECAPGSQPRSTHCSPTATWPHSQSCSLQGMVSELQPQSNTKI